MNATASVIDSCEIVILIPVAALPLLLAACFLIGWRIEGDAPRAQFTLRGLLLLATIVAIGCGIVRLPLALLDRCVMLWGLLVCAAGVVVAMPLISPGAGSDRRG